MRESEQFTAAVEQIRLAFASGQSAAGEALFTAALDAGMPWEVATQAVADGISVRYDTGLTTVSSKSQSLIRD